jgi:bifunctional non-homologous end joining protein LigD
MDYLQNIRGKTIVAPYSVRPRAGAPVSTPLNWDEVAGGRVNQKDYNIETIFDRLQKVGDPFSGVIEEKQNIDKILKYIEENRNQLKGF